MIGVKRPTILVAQAVIAALFDLLLRDIMMRLTEALKLAGPEGILWIGLLAPSNDVVSNGRFSNYACGHAELTERLFAKLG